MFVDVEDYFSAVMSAISKATRSVHVLGWAFHPMTAFEPQIDCADADNSRIAEFLKATALKRPELDIRILCWKAALPIAVTQDFYPQRAAKEFRGTTIGYHLDGRLPVGASHHQKVVVVDDAVAFCGAAISVRIDGIPAITRTITFAGPPSLAHRHVSPHAMRS
uniref:PLD phosphodiesterase domain-containing protein n=1 Tax=Phenylobacterium glaciei TaxID=2803784 RepID=A0A974P7B9_9CAUL|nr:hypothetical protein JKL49_13195 [Phenylobacterium glaciei]